MPIFPNINEYTLDVEWLLTWYPVRGANVRLVEPRHVGDSKRFKSTDTGLDMDNPTGIHVKPFLKDAAENDTVVTGHIAVAVDPRTLVFQVEVAAVINGSRPASKRKRLVLPPDTTVPFLLNVLSPDGDETFSHGTGIAFEGVITTGHRFGLSEVVTQVVVSLGRG